MSSELPHDHEADDAVLSRSHRLTRRRLLAVGAGVLGVGLARALPAYSAATTVKRSTKKKRTTTTVKPATTATTAAKPTAATAAVSAAGQTVLSFTYAVSEGGFRVRNPYLAVWLEDANGTSVRTLLLSFEEGKGMKWLPDLVKWYRADQIRQTIGGTDLISTITSATRTPGDVKVMWDGLSDTKAPLPAGPYVLNIEGAREKGPYSFVRKQITLGSAVDTTLPDDGELTKIRVVHTP
jgi:hypothetical protein